MKTALFRMALVFFGLNTISNTHAAQAGSAEVQDPFDHAGWDALLQSHVRWNFEKTTTTTNYSGFLKDRQKLNLYLNSLSRVDEKAFKTWSKPSQLAFLINTYNAFTVELILTRYPALESIKELGSLLRSPWKRAFISLFGKNVSLDDIEHGMIRDSSRFQEPRIHFAVNCASIGCPALRDEAYTGQRLEEQLEEQTFLFLRDASRNKFKDGQLTISPIFKWYRKDFESGFRGHTSLAGFLSNYEKALGLTAAETTRLREGKINLKFGDYDWRLNTHGRPQ